MAGSLVVDQAATWQTCILMGAAPRMKFGTVDTQDSNADGVPKWDIQAAVTYRPTFDGQRLQSEVLSVTVTSINDPADGIPVPSAVVFEQLRVGSMPPELNRETDRIRGGRLFYTAQGVRVAVPARSRGE
jgi:hypothetical protein